MESSHLTNTLFSSFDLPKPLMKGIAAAGYDRCTPIQAESLPQLLAGQDITGQAQTGTGKTAAFLIAMFNRLLRSPPAEDNRPVCQPRGVIIAPTRELAIQIHSDALQLGKYTGLSIEVVYGGAGYETQQKIFQRHVDILIGTPGRMIDFHKQRLFDLKAAEVLVLDEADRMFDLGFIKDIRYLLHRMPKPEQRLSMLFSATLTYRVNELSYEHMNNPQLVHIETERVTADKIKQTVYYTSNEEKIPLLLGLLQDIASQRTLIFVNTKHVANRVCAYLQANDFNADTLSGDVPQKKRIALLKRFQQGELAIMVATDVAARGLHIPDISHVINYDLPQDPEDYVHRVGRTARAGASGDAISFACEDYAFSLPEIEHYLHHKIPLETITPALLLTPKQPPASSLRRPGRHGGRPAQPGRRARTGGSRSDTPRRRSRPTRSRTPAGKG